MSPEPEEKVVRSGGDHLMLDALACLLSHAGEAEPVEDASVCVFRLKSWLVSTSSIPSFKSSIKHE
jgi:hypothetical protein